MELSLKNYLKKFEQFLPLESRVRNVVVQVFQEMFMIALERRKITVSGSKIFINGSAALRSELVIKQAKILARIQEIDPSLLITEIR